MKKRIKRNPNRWIFTKERLPEVSKWYLVMWEDGYVSTDMFDKVRNRFIAGKVVAWMEVPTPPIKGRFTY